MNIVKCSITKCEQHGGRKTTESGFKTIRPGQYEVPRVETRMQSSEIPNADGRAEKESVDRNNCRPVRSGRFDSTQPGGGGNRSAAGGIQARPSLTGSGPSSQQRSVGDELFKKPTTDNLGNISALEHDVCKRVDDFVANCTPSKQLLTNISQANLLRCNVFAKDSADGAVAQKKSRNNSALANKNDVRSKITNGVVLVLTEGRGTAQGEVGLAAIDLKRPVLVLCQISDTHTYANTINKINILNPAEILIPNTFIGQMQGAVILNIIKSRFPSSAIITAPRKCFRENEGRLYLKNAIIPECVPMLEQVYAKYYAVSAAAALLKHIEFNHKVVFSSGTLKIEYEGMEKSMIIDANSAMRLELVLNTTLNTKNTLYSVLNHCITIGGKRRLRSSILQPSNDIQLIHNRQEAVEEILIISEHDFLALKNILHRFTDVEQLYWLCTKISEDAKQNLCKFRQQTNYALLLKTILETLPVLLDILKPFKSEYICDISKTLSNSGYSKMLEIIKLTLNKESIRSKGFAQSQFQRCFAVKTGLNSFLDIARTIYSELLEEVNDEIKNISRRIGIEHLFQKYTYNSGFHVQLNVKNIRNFDVKHLPSICKNVQCIGNTVKFTTEELLILNVRINERLREIETLTNKIIFAMLKELRTYISCIYDLCNGVADLDLIFSFVQYSKRSISTRPKFGQFMDVKNSRHPILDFMHSVTVVPNDIYASCDKNLNVITGPNMGGKSIYIRQVALLQIIAQIGCFVPATQAQFRICDRLFTRIGFGDSMESNASTWVLEINEINGIIPSLTNHSMVIIDELCRATSCEEGSSIAWAICEHIMQSRAFIFYATHDVLITKLKYLYCNVVNYHMVAMPARNSASGLTYTHKLQPGVTDMVDYGLALARDLQMPEHLVDHAVEIEKSIRHTKTALPDHPSNEADSILDDCFGKLLNANDNGRLDMSGIRLIVFEMVDKLMETNVDPVDVDRYFEAEL